MSDLAALKAKLDKLQGHTPIPGERLPIRAIDYSPSYVRRADMSYVRPNKDDDDYHYDTTNSYGVVIRAATVPPLATNFAELLRTRDLDKLETEVRKLEERCALLSSRDVLAEQVARYRLDIETSTMKLNKVLNRCRVRLSHRPAYIAPEPSLEDDKILEVPMWWKRAEDDLESYDHRYKCFTAFQQLQAGHYDYGQRLSMTDGQVRLCKIVHRLEHEYTEAQGVAELIGQVREVVEVVLNEAERGWQDEQSVYDLAKAVAIDEFKSKQPNLPHSRLTRKDGQKIPAVLNIPIPKELASDEAVAKLRARFVYCTEEVEFKDMADAAHVWLSIREQCAATRELVYQTNATREGRRLAVEEHYARVRDDMTAQTLTLSSIREAYGTMGSL